MNNRLGNYSFWSLIYLFAAFFVFGCSDETGSGRNGRGQLIPVVEAVQAKYGSLPLVERLTGLVKANNQVEIYPEISAVIKTVHVQNGDEVEEGQALISLRDVEFRERLNQARASLQIAQAQAKQAEAKLNEIESELERSRALIKKNLLSEAEIEEIETRVIVAEAEAELARARVKQALSNAAEYEEDLSRTVIKAPVSGTVGNRNAEIGMTVGPGLRLFTLGQLDSVRVEVVLTDRMLSYIETGQRTEIITSGFALGNINAELSRISPFLHPVTHSTSAEIDMPNKDHILKPGMFVAADIFYGESQKATLVPLSALYENPLTGATGIYAGRDSLNHLPSGSLSAEVAKKLSEPVLFEFVPVEVIAKGRMSAAVAGVESGTWIITIGQDLLGGEPGSARVRPVDWDWVNRLQNLQREDLLQEIIQKKQVD